MTKKKEGDLPGLPETRTALGKKATRYLELRDELSRRAEEMEKFSKDLADMFIKSKTKKINIDGRVVEHRHVNQEQIRVSRTKAKKEKD